MESKETLYSKLFILKEASVAAGFKFPYGTIEMNKQTIFAIKSVDLINIEEKLGFTIIQNNDLPDKKFRVKTKGGHEYVEYIQTK